MRRLLSLVGVALLATQVGCFLYWESDDDCLYGGGSYTEMDLRNPFSGQCEIYDIYDGGDDCGDSPHNRAVGDEAPIDTQDWAACYGYCDGLDEMSCLAAGGCRGIYVSDCAEGMDCTDTNYTYYGCWQTAPSGPIQGGGCSGLDAYVCSRHDDCVARHYPATGDCLGADCAGEMDPYFAAVGNFESCQEEPIELDGCFFQEQCDEGYYCNAEEICLPPPNGWVPIPCYGYCVPEVDPDPGNCYEPVLCNSLPPDCPDGTLPGVADGCWTGFCIPFAECEEAPPCSDAGSEESCIIRPDCAPIYQGVDCTCDEDGCTCADWIYQECETADSACTYDTDCDDGFKCCYPCGVPGCSNSCMMPEPDGMCPMFP